MTDWPGSAAMFSPEPGFYNPELKKGSVLLGKVCELKTGDSDG